MKVWEYIAENPAATSDSGKELRRADTRELLRGTFAELRGWRRAVVYHNVRLQQLGLRVLRASTLLMRVRLVRNGPVCRRALIRWALSVRSKRYQKRKLEDEDGEGS